MKPDGALATEMEESEVEPSELFCDLGLVVVESRIPHQSPKGRIEGPHCPVCVGDTTKHVCSPITQPQCRSYEAVEREMQMLWRNRIPMCIEVLLLPDCEHGRQKALRMDASFPSLRDRCMLLEQWIVHVLPKRCVEHLTSPRTLFQAVKSYLHFSQLSAWLNLTHGTAPKNVAYRISPPGEFCTSSFSRSPECHTFPVCGVGRSTMVKVMVRALPRLSGIPRVQCNEGDDDEEEEEKEENGSTAGAVSGLDRAAILASTLPLRRVLTPPLPQAETNQPQSLHQLPKTFSILRQQQLQQQQLQQQQQHSADMQDALARATRDADLAMQWTLQQQQQQRESPSPTHDMHLQRKARLDRPNTSFQKSTDFGAIPKRKAHRSPPPDYFDHHAMSAPELDTLTHTEPGKHKAVNSKVITNKKGTRHSPVDQDLLWGSPSYSSVISKDSTDSDTSSPDIDKLLNKTLGSKPEPMTPEEMEDYLSRLCISRTRTKQPSPTEQLTRAEQKAWRLTTSVTDAKTVHAKLSPDHCLSTPSQSVNYKDGASDFYKSPCSHKLINSSDEEHRVITHNKISSPVEQAMQCRQTQTQTPLYRALSPKSWLSQRLEDKVKFSIGPKEEEDDTSKLYLQDELDNEAKSVQNGHSSHAATVPPESPGVSSQTAVSPRDRHLPSSTDQTSGSVHSRPPFHKSISDPVPLSPSNLTTVAPGSNRASNLLKSVMRRDLAQQLENPPAATGLGQPIPTSQDQANFQKTLRNSTSMIFHPTTGLPMQSSPAPMKKRTSASFEYDISLTSARTIKNSLSCVNLDKQNGADDGENNKENKFYSTSAPASTNCLLVNFEESMLNGRLEPTGVVDGFTADLSASGAFCPKHMTLPVTAFFFKLSDDNAPSPYLGHINLEPLGKRGYHVPKKGTVQVTLFNPNKAVVKMFVVMYDMSDMPANCQTFLRQRTLYMPVKGSPSDVQDAPVFLRYLIHLRFSSSKSGKIYLHTDIRLIFARDKVEYDSRVANYELRSFTEGPINPHFSPKR